MSFKLKMNQEADRKGSNIILALDLPLHENPDDLFSKSVSILDAVHSHVCAVKFNRHLVLPLGLFDNLQRLVSHTHGYGLQAIMDCKINDIGNTNRIIAEYYFQAGFDAVTANPFVGWEEGLAPVFELARQADRGVILLVYMSHKGAAEGYGQSVCDEATDQVHPQYRVFAQKAKEWGADGAVVGATYPEKLRETKLVLREEVPIYSPGLGVQGGRIDTAIQNGAKYLIVGRAITLADNPTQTAEDFKLAAEKALRKTIRL